LSLTAEGNGFWTVLAVYRGSALSNLVEVACSGGQQAVSTIHLPVTAGNTYLLQLGGWYLDRGTYRLRASLAQSPMVDEQEPNDSPATATFLPLDQTFAGTFQAPGRDQDWYRVTLPGNGTLSVRLTPRRGGGAWSASTGVGIRITSTHTPYPVLAETYTTSSPGSVASLAFPSAPGDYHVWIFPTDLNGLGDAWSDQPYTVTATFVPATTQPVVFVSRRIDTSETWSGAVYVIQAPISIAPGATLTVRRARW
jgi:hypothetical protein